jgi:hypothetical protein
VNALSSGSRLSSLSILRSKEGRDGGWRSALYHWGKARRRISSIVDAIQLYFSEKQRIFSESYVEYRKSADKYHSSKNHLP